MTTHAARHTTEARPASPAAPGILLGIGLGGFVDGIVLHQILQWHQMLSTTEAYGAETLENLQVNVTADGFFHAVTWLFVVVGLVVLWRVAGHRALRASWRNLLGWILVGWGAFNLVEGVIDHHLLQIHRVRPDAANPLAWDIAFLVLGAVLVAGGWLLQRSDTPSRQRAAMSGPSSRS